MYNCLGRLEGRVRIRLSLLSIGEEELNPGCL